MKQVAVVHAALALIGLVFGVAADLDGPSPSMSWKVLPFVFFISMLVCVVGMGFFVLVSNAEPLKYFFWWCYLSMVFGLSIGVGQVLKSLYLQNIEPASFFTLLGSAGYLVGLALVAKIQLWRHGESF
ncbi:hypothetical protein GCM10007053_10470 [Halioglobus pacificus]|uniref:Uncharacterized protein n=1 Tax=Parahalioglobus pacificus TaxID=930806 RepID=A0A918XFE9_9GAMM|nr:hypothetical protein GCM10007053_10470 [Halioglobus pacificus]